MMLWIMAPYPLILEEIAVLGGPELATQTCRQQLQKEEEREKKSSLKVQRHRNLFQYRVLQRTRSVPQPIHHHRTLQMAITLHPPPRHRTLTRWTLRNQRLPHQLCHEQPL